MTGKFVRVTGEPHKCSLPHEGQNGSKLYPGTVWECDCKMTWRTSRYSSWDFPDWEIEDPKSKKRRLKEERKRARAQR